jgi:hypothetical protein
MNRIASANEINEQVYGKNYGDDKLQKNLKTDLVRTYLGRIFFLTLLADVYATPAVIWHLTIWTWILHTVAFSIPIHRYPNLARLTHGPSFNGAFSLAACYCWTLYANPTMEFDLAPKGRPDWLIYLRGFGLHFFPVIAVMMDIITNKLAFRTLYRHFDNWSAGGLDYKYPLGFLTCLGSIALGLIWEIVNGDPSGTYNVTTMTNEEFVLGSKVIGTSVAILSYFFILRPLVYGDRWCMLKGKKVKN